MPTYGTDTFIWTGVDQLQAVLTNASPRATAFLGGAMEDVMAYVFDESQQQVPVLTGSLRSSGHIEPANSSPGNILVTIGYGAPYAWFVHENLAAHHPHGKAKYLEDPMRDALDSLVRQLQGRLEGAIVGGGSGPGSIAHAAESSMLSGGVNRRSLAQRSGMSSAHVEQAMKQMRSMMSTHPSLRPSFSQRRNRLSHTWQPAPGVRFNYDPTRKGERGSLKWPG